MELNPLKLLNGVVGWGKDVVGNYSAGRQGVVAQEKEFTQRLANKVVQVGQGIANTTAQVGHDIAGGAKALKDVTGNVATTMVHAADQGIKTAASKAGSTSATVVVTGPAKAAVGAAKIGTQAVVATGSAIGGAAIETGANLAGAAVATGKAAKSAAVTTTKYAGKAAAASAGRLSKAGKYAGIAAAVAGGVAVLGVLTKRARAGARPSALDVDAEMAKFEASLPPVMAPQAMMQADVPTLMGEMPIEGEHAQRVKMARSGGVGQGPINPRMSVVTPEAVDTLGAAPVRT